MSSSVNATQKVNVSLIWPDCAFFLYENSPVSGLHVVVHTSELGVWQRPDKLLAGGMGKRAVDKPIELQLTGISKTGYSRMMTGMITGSHSFSPKNTCQLVNKIWTGLSLIKISTRPSYNNTNNSSVLFPVQICSNARWIQDHREKIFEETLLNESIIYLKRLRLYDHVIETIRPNFHDIGMA